MREELHLTMHDTSKCWYRENCPNVDSKNCNWSCQRMQQTKYLFDLSNLRPSQRKAQKLDISVLDQTCQVYINGILGDVPYFVRNGFNAYFYGGTGTGKTSWATEIIITYFYEIAEKNHNECRGLFISVPTLLRNIKMDIGHPNCDPYFVEFIKTIETTDLVVWDDIIQTNPTDFESQWLYSLINERLLRKRANIFTSNLNPQDLSKVDNRLYSRICTISDCIKFSGKDLREKGKFSYVVKEFVKDNPDVYNINSVDYDGYPVHNEDVVESYANPKNKSNKGKKGDTIF